MATVQATIGKATERYRSVAIPVAWLGMVSGDVGAPVELPVFSDRTVQVNGTLGAGGSIVVEGSIDGVEYLTLNDPQGLPLEITTKKVETIMEIVKFIRPRVAAGDGTTLVDVHILMVGAV